MKAIYEQIADDLREAITNGTYKVGTSLPSMRELSVKHCVSAGPVQRAIAILQSEGLIHCPDRGSPAVVMSPVIPERVWLSITREQLELLNADDAIGVLFKSTILMIQVEAR